MKRRGRHLTPLIGAACVISTVVVGLLVLRPGHDVVPPRASTTRNADDPTTEFHVVGGPDAGFLLEAIQELGRLGKTRHLLAYVDDEQLRRRVLRGLNRQERLHSMARAIAFARAGRFPDRDYEAQLDRASALSVVINAIVVWNTRYLAAAADLLAARGEAVPEDVWPHVSPLHWEHVNLVGRYRFEEPAIVGDLRPLGLRDGGVRRRSVNEWCDTPRSWCSYRKSLREN